MLVVLCCEDVAVWERGWRRGDTYTSTKLGVFGLEYGMVELDKSTAGIRIRQGTMRCGLGIR